MSNHTHSRTRYGALLCASPLRSNTRRLVGTHDVSYRFAVWTWTESKGHEVFKRQDLGWSFLEMWALEWKKAVVVRRSLPLNSSKHVLVYRIGPYKRFYSDQSGYRGRQWSRRWTRRGDHGYSESKPRIWKLVDLSRVLILNRCPVVSEEFIVQLRTKPSFEIFRTRISRWKLVDGTLLDL